MVVPRVEKAYEKHAWMIPFTLGAIYVVFGLFIALTSGLGAPDCQAVAHMTCDELSSGNPQIATYLALSNRTFGVVLMGIGFFGMAISLKSYRRGEKWSWYALWYLPVLFGIHAALEFGAGAVSDGQQGVVVLMVSILGLLLPYRKFFPKQQITPA